MWLSGGLRLLAPGGRHTQQTFLYQNNRQSLLPDAMLSLLELLRNQHGHSGPTVALQGSLK
jgi:hypothetical protein